MPSILLKLKNMDWGTSIVAAMLLGMAPFFPQPHLVQKIGFLMNGTLSKPIDIFDLFFHSSMLVLLLLKVGVHAKLGDWSVSRPDNRPSYKKSSPLDEDDEGQNKKKASSASSSSKKKKKKK